MLLTLANNWIIIPMAIVFVIVCLFLMLVILIQKPKGGGLSGAFGGAGGSANAAFGAKTGDVLTWFTVVCFVLFILLAMGLTWAIHPQVLPQDTPAAAGTDAANPLTEILDETGGTMPGEDRGPADDEPAIPVEAEAANPGAADDATTPEPAPEAAAAPATGADPTPPVEPAAP